MRQIKAVFLQIERTLAISDHKIGKNIHQLLYSTFQENFTMIFPNFSTSDLFGIKTFSTHC